ncbi:MAG: TIGR01212 family radical SAM protein [Bacteroidales bacterium]|nr:TIGR01212 family radical SAM protein [Bacteroidales bacterium]
MPYPWNHSRRFNSYTQYMRGLFGDRVQKLTLDAGFTCPNRDGTVSTGGCTYCNNDAFNPSYCVPEKSITQQIMEGILFHEKRYREANQYMAYFQAYSNTYAPLETLKSKYEEALSQQGVIGLAIGTRPDCIDEEKLEYLRELSKTYYIIVEYGIESCYNKTLELINRGHTFEKAAEVIEMTASYNIKTGAHLILGLPEETREMMLEEAKILSSLPLNNLKLHQLQIVKGTKMEADYKDHPDHFHFFSIDEYIELVVDFAELLNPDIVLERIAGETVITHLTGPSWENLRYYQVLAAFENRMKARDTWQGKLWKE